MVTTKKTTLWVIRHGETIWNAEERFQGHGDSPLTANGRRQVEALAERMKGIDVDLLIASDLGRAQESAAIIAASTGHPIHTDSRLRERSFGLLEGLTAVEIRKGFPGVYEQMYADAPDYAPPEGESLRQHYQRNIAFIEELVATRPGITAALVVHGGVLDSLFRHTARLPLDQPRCFTTANASLSRFTHGTFYGTTRWVIETWCDSAHLDGIGQNFGLG